jgi:hypothetical protein
VTTAQNQSMCGSVSAATLDMNEPLSTCHD